MEEAYKFVARIFKTNMSYIFNKSFTESRPVMWARWCLPTVNPNCNQDLKGHFADADNSSCDTLVNEYRKKNTFKN